MEKEAQMFIEDYLNIFGKYAVCSSTPVTMATGMINMRSSYGIISTLFRQLLTLQTKLIIILNKK